MHSAGLFAMSRLMDRIMPHITLELGNPNGAVADELEMIKPMCHWTSGRWEALNLEWDEVQNVSSSSVRALTNFLVRTHALKGVPLSADSVWPDAHAILPA